MRSIDKSPNVTGYRSPLSASLGPSELVANEIVERVVGTLPINRGAHLATVLAASALEAACYEASVRGQSGGTLRAGRMMIERATPSILTAVATALDVVLPSDTPNWLDLAHQEHVPLIVGWDMRGGGIERCVKLYVNASDASAESRARLCAALVPAVTIVSGPPAVIGMNVRADGVVETKLYVQSANAVALSRELDPHAQMLATAAHEEGADAGGVLSFDADGNGARPRAFFVALREPADEEGWECVRSLPGYDGRRVESLLPFAPAPPRSVGLSLTNETWTLYCKPRESGRAPETLEPAAIFRIDGTEVGVFVEPTEHAARAFRRTARHAVSVRVRHGSAEPIALESLVDWFTDQLRTAELDGGDLTKRLGNPPAPWRLREATGQIQDTRGRS